MIYVRSQDGKKLIPNPKLLVQYDTGNWNVVDMDTGAIMASYGDEEKALNVIDKIVEFMTIKDTQVYGNYNECTLQMLGHIHNAIMPRIYIIEEEED